MSENDLKKDLRDLKEKNNKDSNKNDVLYFFLGIVLLGLGLFMLSKRVMVNSSWYTWRVGGLNLSSGTVTIPLIIGIIWYFFDTKSVIAKIIITLGIIFIVATIIMSIRIYFITTSMFDYILIIGMAAAGSGLLLRTLFKKR
jgi:hypothetical protein